MAEEFKTAGLTNQVNVIRNDAGEKGALIPVWELDTINFFLPMCVGHAQ